MFDDDVIQAMADNTAEFVTAFDQRREALARCIKKVDQKQTALLHDYYTASQSLREIDETSGRGFRAVKMTLMRIRQGCLSPAQ